MSSGFIVTGTDTGIGKTIFSAALAGALGGYYWKPIQAGLEGETDSDVVRRLSGLAPDRVLPEAYRLKIPASPHIAAAGQSIEINPERLPLPWGARPLVIEGAGGLLVPLSDDLLQIDQFASWGLPVILCARTKLGTINHTLLSLEALAKRAMRVHGVVFIGNPDDAVERTITRVGKARRLGRLPTIEPLNAARLAEAFRANFDLRNFGGIHG
jgi:dethiobiotin synthetase